jgi:hypothetical protein
MAAPYRRPRAAGHAGSVRAVTPSGAVSVEEVEGRKALQRFLELPQALHGRDPRWAPPVMAWERYRLDPQRNPFFERGDAVYLLARLRGRPAGRITAQVHHPGAAAGAFGFWWTVDDDAVAAALLDAARAWLAARGCTEAIGPASFTAADEPGVQVDGFEVPGVTGRPWHPHHLAARLEEAGGVPTGTSPPGGSIWPRLRTRSRGRSPHRASRGRRSSRGSPSGSQEQPGQAGPYGDPRLALGPVAAVPDVADAMRSAGVRSAWSLARRARVGTGRVRPSCAATASRPRWCRASQRGPRRRLPLAGRAVVAGPGRRPEAVHRTYRVAW